MEMERKVVWRFFEILIFDFFFLEQRTKTPPRRMRRRSSASEVKPNRMKLLSTNSTPAIMHKNTDYRNSHTPGSPPKTTPAISRVTSSSTNVSSKKVKLPPEEQLIIPTPITREEGEKLGEKELLTLIFNHSAKIANTLKELGHKLRGLGEDQILEVLHFNLKFIHSHLKSLSVLLHIYPESIKDPFLVHNFLTQVHQFENTSILFFVR